MWTTLCENQPFMYKYKIAEKTFECLTTGQIGVNILKNSKKEEKIEFTAWGKDKDECLQKATELIKLSVVSQSIKS